MRRFSCIGVVCSIAAGSSVNASDFPSFPVARSFPPPVLDGRLDDDTWNDSALAKDFVTNRDHKPARFATEFRVVHDADALYVTHGEFLCPGRDRRSRACALKQTCRDV